MKRARDDEEEDNYEECARVIKVEPYPQTICGDLAKTWCSNADCPSVLRQPPNTAEVFRNQYEANQRHYSLRPSLQQTHQKKRPRPPSHLRTEPVNSLLLSSA